MVNPYALQLISNKNVQEFFDGIPSNERDIRIAKRNKLVLLAVVSLLEGRSQHHVPLRRIKARAGVSLTQVKNALHDLKNLDLLVVMHYQGLPCVMSKGRHFEALFGPIADE